MTSSLAQHALETKMIRWFSLCKQDPLNQREVQCTAQQTSLGPLSCLYHNLYFSTKYIKKFCQLTKWSNEGTREAVHGCHGKDE